MYTLLKRKAILVLTLAMLVTGGAVQAATIRVLDMDWSKAMSLYIKADGVEENAWAGAIRIRLNDLYDREAFCVDLFTNISLNRTYNTTVLPPAL